MIAWRVIHRCIHVITDVDTAMTSVLRVLATVQKSSGEQLNIKVIYKREY